MRLMRCDILFWIKRIFTATSQFTDFPGHYENVDPKLNHSGEVFTVFTDEFCFEAMKATCPEQVCDLSDFTMDTRSRSSFTEALLLH